MEDVSAGTRFAVQSGNELSALSISGDRRPSALPGCEGQLRELLDTATPWAPKAEEVKERRKERKGRGRGKEGVNKKEETIQRKHRAA